MSEKKVVIVGANQLGRGALAAALNSLNTRILAEQSLPRAVSLNEQSHHETRKERRARERLELKARSKK